MAALARLWVVNASGLDPRGPRADALAERLGRRPLAAIVHASSPLALEFAAAVARRCAAPLVAASDDGDGSPSGPAEADRLAARHGAAELLWLAFESIVQAACAHALQRSGTEPRALRLAPGALCAFDWPTGAIPGLKPVLLGIDLDWLPAWKPDAPPDFRPGGPGSAGTERAPSPNQG